MADRAQPAGPAARGRGPGRRLLAGPLLLLGAVTLGLVAACGGGSRQPDLPDFPDYEQAEAFLQMQERLRAHQPEQPQPHRYSERNEVIYDNLRARLRANNAELEWRARQREDNRARGRAMDEAEFQAMQQRLARDEALAALRAQQRAENGRARDAGARARYENYHNRLDQLARRQEGQAQERELNRYRHQQRVAGSLEELQKNRELTLRLEQEQAARQQAAAAESAAN